MNIRKLLTNAIVNEDMLTQHCADSILQEVMWSNKLLQKLWDIGESYVERRLAENPIVGMWWAFCSANPTNGKLPVV